MSERNFHQAYKNRCNNRGGRGRNGNGENFCVKKKKKKNVEDSEYSYREYNQTIKNANYNIRFNY